MKDKLEKQSGKMEIEQCKWLKVFSYPINHLMILNTNPKFEICSFTAYAQIGLNKRVKF